MTSVPPYFAVFRNKKIETTGWRRPASSRRAVDSRHSFPPRAFILIMRHVDEEPYDPFYNAACRQTAYGIHIPSRLRDKNMFWRSVQRRKKWICPLPDEHFLSTGPTIPSLLRAAYSAGQSLRAPVPKAYPLPPSSNKTAPSLMQCHWGIGTARHSLP